MTDTRPTYTVGEVIYPRQFDRPLCMDCDDSPRVHRYVVVSADKMAPNGCDGDPEAGHPCPCARYRANPAEDPNLRVAPEREEAWARYPNDAFSMLEPSEAPTARCNQPLCRAPIWWGLTAANHKRCPFDIKPDGTRTGTSHWRTCRDRPTGPPKQSRRART